MPFVLTKVPEDCTLGELVKKHGMKVSTFWLLNAGVDVTGMFPQEELTDAALEDKTEPLPADEPASSVEPASIAPAASAIEAASEPPQKQQKAVRGRSAVGQDDAVYGSAAKRAKRQ